MKRIGILGATGSIGTQTLAVVRALNGRPESEGNPHIEVCALAAGRNIALLAEQAIEFQVPVLAISNEADVSALRRLLGDHQAEILVGADGLCDLAGRPMDLLVTAIVGMRGLKPTLTAIEQGTDIALANKETLVAAGDLVMDAARKHGVQILPVDSEHSAVFQCLRSCGKGGAKETEKIILTASGGPFRGYTKDQLAGVTLEAALNHPTWKMGGKITVDCASMMNKGLEVIEAMHLFQVPVSQIEVVVHPQSIVHSMVMFQDGSVLAQLGNPDMKVPIQLAITDPYRAISETRRLDLAEIGKLTFERPDLDVFPCLRLAYHAAAVGGTLPAVMNGANEQAVDFFLKKQMKFTDIPYIIEQVMLRHEQGSGEAWLQNPNLENILGCDAWAKAEVRRLVCP